MAHPADPVPKEPAFAIGRLTPEQADYLASMFRPSWELDDAPFTGPGSLSDTEVQALAPDMAVRAEIRATAVAQARPVTNGTHGPSASTANEAAAPPAAVPAAASPAVSLRAEIPSVVVDPSAAFEPTVPAFTAPVAPPVAHEIPAPVPSSAPAARPSAPAQRISAPPARVSQRPVAPPSFVAMSAAKARAVSAAAGDLDAPTYPKTSKKGLWIGIAASAGALVVALSMWAASTGGSSDTTQAPASTATNAKTSEERPPTPTETARPTSVAAATTAAAAPIPRTPVTALPVAPPPQPVREPVRAAPPPRVWTPPPRPAPRKSGNQTIVRDVPF